MKKLEGKRIALLGSRKIEEISKIVENLGGIAVSRPAQGTSLRVDTKLKDHIQRITAGKFDWIIFTTGIGVETLYNTALEMGMGEEFIGTLHNTRIAARGYKTVNLLKKLGLSPEVRDDDGSTAGLVRSLAAYSFEKSNVALQLHGDPAPKLIQWLDEQHAQYEEILPYIHNPPETEVMERLLSELLEGKLEAAVFTSTPQVRHLIQFARKQDAENVLKRAFSDKVIALAVGKVTAQALYDEGINRVIFPKVERMGSAIVELANYYQMNTGD
ncbi:uroporphyrinogen-III synthase [Bacillus sp. ISL-47]|uniref:uroporphyrinogen-III synthase n=1 Tax=Bacillus sp. ISL-47 TaxID=2819130 RepID=UPI001BE66C51|nr:uroporphyrinogen-III synthase [Bacillus sp. ISL-47]MBT2690348.1 uroporphyrinogen-III synthase [Bacillus sp. ISL-47]MBT2709202.1 uroporphyrinogen-III synthase [Pseudomonas sp. ISL-84]